MTKNIEKKLPACPIETVISMIGNKWKFLIIRDLLEGKKRFGELKSETGASQKSLTIHLRELEEEGILTRQSFPTVPPKVEYTLTDIGYSLAPVLEVMAQWGTDYKEYCKLKKKLEKQRNKDK